MHLNFVCELESPFFLNTKPKKKKKKRKENRMFYDFVT